MPRWDLENTREQVERHHGYDQLQIVRKCLDSIIDRQRYTKYHFGEYHRLLAKQIDNKLSEKNIYEITFTLTPIERVEFEICMTRVEANIVACIQSLHSIADIFAHTVYFSLGLNSTALKLNEDRINIYTTARLLDRVPEFSKIAQSLRGITNHENFIYLSALVNHSKHRSIVGTVLFIDPPAKGLPPYTLRFEEFTYNNISYQSRDIPSFLEPAYEWMSQEIDVCGSALNQTLNVR